MRTANLARIFQNIPNILIPRTILFRVALFCSIGILSFLLFYPNPTIRIGKHALTYELADSSEKRERGLMFRRSIPQNHGMLFVFPEVQKDCCFWMKNTLIPLDIAYIGKDFRILDIITRQPLSTAVSCVPETLFVIETNAGWFSSRAIKKGAQISIFRTNLLEIYRKLW